MKFQAVSGTVLALLFIGMFGMAFNVLPAEASGTIFIKADGRVEGTVDIVSADNITYTFVATISDEIIVERDHIVVDGAGYSLQGTGSGTGLDLSDRSNVTLTHMKIVNFRFGIRLSQSSSSTVSGNNITDNDYGLILGGSSNNTVSRNNVTDNDYGIYLSQSSNNTVSGNTVRANIQYGIVLSASSNTRLRGNRMIDNRYNFRVSGPNISNFVNDIDPSNTVDNKPIYYWIDRRDAAVPLDAGYVALVNCTRITAHTLDLSKNYQGAVFVHTTNSTITESEIVSNSLGIQFLQSSDNTVSGNTVRANIQYGVVLSASSNNTLSGNNIVDNEYGVVLSSSSDNAIYHNNFINTHQADTYDSTNGWDNSYPSGGNYWNDYTGVDEKSGPNQEQPGSDGLGDTPYLIATNNLDRYPLMPSRVDSTPPTTTDNYDGAWHTADFHINLTATDDLTGVTETYYEINKGLIHNLTIHGQPLIITEGANNTIEYWSIDKADNEEVPHNFVTAIKLDKTPPTGEISIENGDPYTTTPNVTLTLGATDATSGVAEMRFSNDNTTWSDWEPAATSKSWILLTADGTKTVYYQIRDNAGLISETYSDIIILDTAPPTGSIAINDDTTYTTTTTITLTLSAADITSGISEMRFSHNNVTYTEWQPYTPSEPWTLQDGDGTKTICVQFKDQAGLISTYADTIVLDTTQPTGTIAIAEGVPYTNSTSVMLTLAGEDTTSGVAQMHFSKNNVTWTPWEAYSTSKAWTLTTGDATKTVYVQFKDNAGLISPSYQDSIILDTTNPVANAGDNQTAPEDTPVTFDSAASTDENGITSYTWTFTDTTPQTLSGQNPTYTFNTPGQYTITLNVTDAAGNWATDTLVITVSDITKPTANAGPDQTRHVGKTITFDASASSDNVAIISYEWDFGDETTATGITTTHAYADPGTYTATLTVTDAAGNTDTCFITVRVLRSLSFLPWVVGATAAILIGMILLIVIVVIKTTKTNDSSRTKE